jgi:hypothetical protein
MLCEQNFITHVVKEIGNMPLGAVRSAYDVAKGRKLLEIASNDWLSTTSINSIMYSI